MIYLRNKTCDDILLKRLDTYYSNCRMLGIMPKTLADAISDFNEELFEGSMTITERHHVATEFRALHVQYVI